MLKRFFPILAGLALLTGTASAVVPLQMNVQGSLLNADGTAVDGTFTIAFAFYNGPGVGATELWKETIASVPASKGVFDELLGAAATPLQASIFTGNTQLWLGIRVVAGPGVAVGGEAELPRKPLTSVAYAFQSQNAVSAASADNLTCNGCVAVTELGFDVATQAELDSAIALPATSALDLQCTGCVSVSELGFDPATQAELDAAITAEANARTSADTTLTNNLAGEVTARQNADTVLTNGLAGEVTARTNADTTLTNSIAAEATARQNADTAEANARAAAVSAVEAKIPTSVNNLAGGNITSAVTIQGKDVCTAAGNCIDKDTLASLNCTANQLPKYSGTAWGCVDLSSLSTPPKCNGLWQTLQYTGTAWTCVDVRNTGLSVGQANGYELIDAWGYAWDGIQRAPRNWSQAKADCEAEGGRLPTATELFRNNAGQTGTGNIGTPNDTAHLWTLIASYHTDIRRTIIRLDTGAVTYELETNTRPYRCVWPDHTGAAFEGDNCYGPPGSECQARGLWENVDKYDRPPLNLTAATNECAFYQSTIVRLRDAEELIQGPGWPNHLYTPPVSNGYIWTGNKMHYTGGAAVFNWGSGSPTPWWSFQVSLVTPQSSSWDYYYTDRQFRCVGKKDASYGKQPSPTCNGGAACFKLDKGYRSRLIADNVDRTATNYQGATEACRALGAALPKMQEVESLLRAGWGNGSGNWLWTADGENGTAVWGYYVIKFTAATANERVSLDNGTMWSYSGPTGSYSYRCIWRETFEAQASQTTCGAAQNQSWDSVQGKYVCTDAVNGNDNGNANPFGTGYTDPWGNRWDSQQRSGTGSGSTWSEAKAICEGIGGRLPTPTELYRVRFTGQSISPSIGSNTDTSYLWTLAPEYRPDYYMSMRVSDGGASAAINATGTKLYFRCMWPTTKGDTFGGRSCYGEKTDPCFKAGRYRVDRFDRPLVTQAAANWECNYFGGRLLDLPEWLEVIHAGLPNGTNNWNWSYDPVPHGSYYGYMLAKWTGLGTTSWVTDGSVNTSWSHSANYYSYRCMFTDTME